MIQRSRLRGYLRLACAVAGVCIAELSQAGAPLAKTSPPGFYRIMVGAIEVTALSDGTEPLPMDTLLTHITPDRLQKAFARSYLKPPIETSVNAYLINTGAKLVLIDTGGGKLLGPGLGKLRASLEAAGY